MAYMLNGREAQREVAISRQPERAVWPAEATATLPALENMSYPQLRKIAKDIGAKWAPSREAILANIREVL